MSTAPEEAGQGPAAQKDGADNDLLFVTATPTDLDFKTGGRSNIRSHIRKYAARRSTHSVKPPSQPQDPAITAKAAALNYLVPLAPKIPFHPNRQARPAISAPLSKGSDAQPQHKGSVGAHTHGRYKVQPDALSSHGSPGDPEVDSASEDYFDNEFQPIHAAWEGSEGIYGGRSPRRGSKTNLTRILGNGRVDPFRSYPVEKPKQYLDELIDHFVTYLLPGLVPDDTPPGEVSPITKSWLISCLPSPLLFHGMIFAASVHLDFLEKSKIFPNSPRALPHKIFVIQKLNELIADPSRATQDEIILAILILASHEVMELPEGRRNPFNPPLKMTQWVNVYGNIRYVPEHMAAVNLLIASKGGLENVTLTGLAEIIVIGDVVAATNFLSKPLHPPLKCTNDWIANLMIWAVSPPRKSIQTQGMGFLALKHLGLTNEMLRVFGAIGAITLAIDCYLHHVLTGLKIGAVSRTRTAIQQRLLALPPARELEKAGVSARIGVYECCRLCALIYGVAVIFPVPNPHFIFETLVKSLIESVEALNLKNWESSYPDLALWILVLGGVAAQDMTERPWFISRLRSHTAKLNLQAWNRAEEVLETFFWLDSACGQGGRLLWSEVTNRQ